MKNKMLAILACGCLLTTTGTALAGGFNFDLGIFTGNHETNVGVSTGHHGTSVGVSINAGRPRPVVVARPVTRTVIEHVWVPTTETVYRDVPVLDALGQVIAYKREASVVHGGYYEEVHKKMIFHPGGRRRIVKTWRTRCEHPGEPGHGHGRHHRRHVADEPFNGHSTYAKPSRHEARHPRAIKARTAHRVEKYRTDRYERRERFERHERKGRPIRMIRSRR
jgi:hypothetical protein